MATPIFGDGGTLDFTRFHPDREGKVEGRAVVGGGVVLGPKLSAVGLDDGLTDGKSHPQAVVLGGVEGLEDLVQRVCGYAWAVVGDRGLHHSRLVGCGHAHGDFALGSGLVLHGCKGIEKEVEEDLLKLDLVTARGGEVRSDVEGNAHIAADDVRLNQSDDLADHCRHIERGECGRLLFGQGSHFMNDLAGALVVIDHVAEDLADLAGVERFPGHQAQAGLGVGEVGGEWLG